jgi:hypothetical protein
MWTVEEIKKPKILELPPIKPGVGKRIIKESSSLPLLPIKQNKMVA